MGGFDGLARDQDRGRREGTDEEDAGAHEDDDGLPGTAEEIIVSSFVAHGSCVR
jgi:hypothetical protein